GATSILRYYDKTDKLIQYRIPQLNSFERASSIISHSERIFYIKSIRTQEYNEREINKIENLLAEDFDLIDSTNRALNIETKIYERQKR
ncbi:MAG: hypothetical protein KAU58_07110, partial [Candidatus Omnitrophica bacterium]|nr:hypothetical protein [Candidatus Omnitrophota bacterium]